MIDPEFTTVYLKNRAKTIQGTWIEATDPGIILSIDDKGKLLCEWECWHLPPKHSPTFETMTLSENEVNLMSVDDDDFDYRK